MPVRPRRWAGPLLITVLLAYACGGGGGGEAVPAGGAPAQADAPLTPAQLEHGIGPVTELSLDEVDAALAEEGQAVFGLKCAACHKLTGRYVGPPLGDVLARRRPEYVMNMMLNPAGMLEKHPAAKELLAQYLTPMPNQQLTEAEARAVLEYLRTVGATEQGM